MEPNAKIRQVDLAKLKVIHYPDPRLSQISTPVDVVDDGVRALAARMFELMFAAKGVGLAAPQVGITVRMFVASPTFDPADQRVYINPQLVQLEGEQEAEEGCLSLPDINAKIKRASFAVIRALNLQGEPFEETGEELVARVFQHEYDHIDGRLLIDRMGSVAKIANRRAIKSLEEDFGQK